MNDKKSKKKLFISITTGIVAVIGVCFITSKNMAPSLAKTNIPVIEEGEQDLTFNKVEDEEVLTTLYEEDTELKISYPKIDGMNNTELQDKINTTIKKEILSVAKRMAAEANVVKGSVDATIEDNITVTYNFVTNVNNDEYDHSFTLTLDINTGEVLTRDMK